MNAHLLMQRWSRRPTALAAEILAAAGYDVANFKGSWHEWSRRDDLPVER